MRLRDVSMRLAPLCLGLSMLASAGVQAASQLELGLDRMVALSDEIIVGKVTANETRWEGRLIVTVATVEVGEVVLGDAPSIIEVTQLGGTAIHPRTGLSVNMSASNQTALRLGEEVLLFISRARHGQRHLVGAQQGVYIIREDPRTRERQLPVGPKRLVVLRGGDADLVRTEPVTLEIMRERIRSHIRDQAIQRGRGKR